MPEQLKIFWTPLGYRGFTRQATECIVRDLLPMAQTAYVGYRQYGEDALVSRSRSMILTDFLNSDKDILIWHDADISWAPGNLMRIACSAEQTKGIVGGVVSKRGFGRGIACRINRMEGGGFPTGVDKLWPATHVGAAFQAIHRQALERILEHYNRPETPEQMRLPMCVGGMIPFCIPFLHKHPERPQYDFLSEDWALCVRGIAAGVPIHVDAMPVLKHRGEHDFTVNDAFSGRIESALIFCAGKGGRWGWPEDTPKQLAIIDDEQILHRTVRQLRARGVSEITIVTNDARLEVEGCATFQPKADRWLVETMLSAQPIWKERQSWLFGDVCFTDEAMNMITSLSDLRWLGRRNPSNIIEGAPGEIFGINTGRNLEALSQVLPVGLDHAEKSGAERTEAGTPIGGPWQPFRVLIGADIDQHIVPNGCDNWLEIDDLTSDVDTPQSHVQLDQLWEAQNATTKEAGA